LGRSVLVLTIIASTLGGLVFGYELGIISGALPQLQAQFYLGCVQQEAMVSALLIGLLSASVIGGWLIDRHGRRTSILLSNLLILGGTIILTTRLMLTLYKVGITFGILLAYALNYVLSGVQTTGTSEGLVTEDDSHVFDLFKTKDNMCRRTATGLGLVLSQQFTGQPNVLFYASTILFSVGFQSNTSASSKSLLLLLAIGLIVTGVLCRQSVIDTTKQCTSLEPHSNLTSPAENQENVGINLVNQSTPSAGLSFGPMTWLVLSEIFPKEVRGRAYSFINCFNVEANLIVTFSFLSITDVIGLSGIFFVYGVIGMAAVVFIYIVLPETKGKSLHKIDRELSQTREEFCNIFQRRHFSPGYQRVHLTSTTT
uniref:Solute carrier family 2, facilitated glucose transporter member 10 n=1 Tax=Sinocyclocheilus grahami TaxID=75366 RepID=A0A672P6H9_SINGR